MKNRVSGEKGTGKKKRSKPRLAASAITAEFSLASLPFLVSIFLFFFLLSRGQLGCSRCSSDWAAGMGKLNMCTTPGMLCCTPVRPKWFRSGAVGCEVEGATRASDQRLDVGVVGAGAGGLFLLESSNLPTEGKGFPLWAGLGWGERPAPSRRETGLATVGPSLLSLFSPFFLSFLNLVSFCSFNFLSDGLRLESCSFRPVLAPDHCKRQ